MEIDKDKVRTQDEESEPAPIDQVESRVQSEMKEIEDRARESVAESLQDEELEQAAQQSERNTQRESNEAKKG